MTTNSSKALALALVLVLGAGCDPFHTGFEDVEPAHMYRALDLERAPAPASGDELVVMNWNAKFGGGRIDFFFDCHGDRSLMSADEVEQNLEGITEIVRDVDPDILLMQEIDVASKRAAFVNQVQRILDTTDLNYAAYASQWHADYVPSAGIGAIDSGNVVFSKWPITEATRYALPERTDQDAATSYFYLRRNVLDAEIDLGSGTIHAVNVHTAAYAAGDVKLDQIAQFHDHLTDLHADGVHWVAGGDLNTIPPGSTKRSEFPDSVCTDEDFIADDYGEEPEAIEYLWDSWEPAVSLERYQADEARYFTHTTDKDGFWNRKLDYLFTNRRFVPDTGDVLQSAENGGYETMPVSDHAPVVVRWVVP